MIVKIQVQPHSTNQISWDDSHSALYYTDADGIHTPSHLSLGSPIFHTQTNVCLGYWSFNNDNHTNKYDIIQDDEFVLTIELKPNKGAAIYDVVKKEWSYLNPAAIPSGYVNMGIEVIGKKNVDKLRISSFQIQYAVPDNQPYTASNVWPSMPFLIYPELFETLDVWKISVKLTCDGYLGQTVEKVIDLRHDSYQTAILNPYNLDYKHIKTF